MSLYKFGEGRRRVEREDDLINHRVTWCMLANSFLLVAYFTATGNEDENWRQLIAFVGLVSSLFSLISIIAAWWAIWYLRAKTEASPCGKRLYSPPHIALSGSYASACAPFSILSIWITILIKPEVESPGKIPLLINVHSLAALLVTWTIIWICVEWRLSNEDNKKMQLQKQKKESNPPKEPK
jgi:hypothetical protein